MLKVLDFGAFVELEKGIEGLVHVSEISEEHVEDPLLPEDRCVIRQRGTRHMRERVLVGVEGSIRLERHTRREDARLRNEPVFFVQLDLARQPDHRRIAE